MLDYPRINHFLVLDLKKRAFLHFYPIVQSENHLVFIHMYGVLMDIYKQTEQSVQCVHVKYSSNKCEGRSET